MKTLARAGLIFTAIWLLQSCKGNVENDSKADVDSTAALRDTLTKIGAPIEKADAQFAFDAAGRNITEIELGRLAVQKANNKRIKNFGAMMVKDHTTANNKLMALAKTKNMTLPTAPDGDEQNIIAKLAKKSGKDFDEAYVSDMIDDHQKDIKKFQSASKNSGDPDIKAFALKTLPVLKNHLEAINTIHDSMK